MSNKRLISFDLYNTLVDPTYTTFVWEIVIPQRYAKRYGTNLSEATSIVKDEYERAGNSSLEWYDISYWFEYFKLPGRWQDLMEEHRDKIHPFPEVIEVLKDLAQDHDLIIISNAAREFIEIEIREAHLEKYFARIFSTTSDFHETKKTSHIYRQACEIMGVKPSDAIHVGDHYEYDYVVPKGLGIEAYYLDRQGKKPKADFTVRDLRKFANLIDIAKAPY
jgi:HAD superfamily hydrolase (TIGR01549 family)